jgi:hypothetical protein
MSSEAVPAPAADGEVLNPIVVNLGTQSRKRIKALERGRGELMDEVAAALAQVRNSLDAEDRHHTILPVVFVYKKKRKRPSSIFGLPFGL